jgi:uncharacterized membrane protein YphA (DoxX/SURF4 family)
MIKLLFGVFIVLHGLVHLLYLGQSRRLFELQPGMVWPDGSWAFSRFLGLEATRTMASGLLILAAIGFVAGGVGLLLNQSWWPAVVVGSAIFSTAVYLLLWDGAAQSLADKGGVGILINIAIVGVVYWVR